MSVPLIRTVALPIDESKAHVQESSINSSTSNGRMYSVITDMSSSSSSSSSSVETTPVVLGRHSEVKTIERNLSLNRSMLSEENLQGIQNLPEVLKPLIAAYAFSTNSPEESKSSMAEIRALIRNNENQGYRLLAWFIVNYRPNLNTIGLDEEDIDNLVKRPDLLVGLTFDDATTSMLSPKELRAYTCETHPACASRRRDQKIRYQLLELADRNAKAHNLLKRAFENTCQIVEITRTIHRSFDAEYEKFCNLRLCGLLVRRLKLKSVQALFARCLIPGNWVHAAQDSQILSSWPKSSKIYRGIAKHLNTKSSLDFMSIQEDGPWGKSSPCFRIFKAMNEQDPGREIAIKVLANSVNYEGTPKETLQIIKDDRRFWCTELWQQILPEYQYLIDR